MAGPAEPTCNTSLKQSWTCYLVFCNVSIVLASAFMFGYNAAVINAPFAVMSMYLNESFQRSDVVLEKQQLNYIWIVVVSIHLIGGFIGSLWFPTVLASAIGRKYSLLVASAIGAVGACSSFITPYTGHFVPLFIGRFTVGFATGLAMVVAPGLINEQAPPRLRGALGSMIAIWSATGVTVSNLLGLRFMFGSPNTWHFLFLFVAAVYVFNAICLLFVVESPRYLISCKKYDQSIEALMKLRCATKAHVLSEFETLKQTVAREATSASISLVEMFQRRAYFWPLIIVINLHIVNQLTGLGAAFFYATKVLKEGGLAGDEAGLANFAVSFGTIFGNVINIFVVDKFGRRLLISLGLVGVLFAHIVLIVALYYQIFIASVIGFAVFLLSFSAGPGPIPFFMSAELTMPLARPAALGLGMAVNFWGKLATSLVFPIMNDVIGAFSFVPFAIVALFEFVFFLLFLPETSSSLAAYNAEEQFAAGRSLLQLKRQSRTKKPVSIDSGAKLDNL